MKAFNFNLSVDDIKSLSSRDIRAVYQCPGIRETSKSDKQKIDLHVVAIQFDSKSNFFFESHTLFTLSQNGSYIKQDTYSYSATQLAECILLSLENMQDETFNQHMQQITNIVSDANHMRDSPTLTQQQAAQRFAAMLERQWHLFGEFQRADRYNNFGDLTTTFSTSAKDTNYLRIFVAHDGDTGGRCISIESLRSNNIEHNAHIHAFNIDNHVKNISQVACDYLHNGIMHVDARSLLPHQTSQQTSQQTNAFAYAGAIIFGILSIATPMLVLRKRIGRALRHMFHMPFLRRFARDEHISDIDTDTSDSSKSSMSQRSQPLAPTETENIEALPESPLLATPRRAMQIITATSDVSLMHGTMDTTNSAILHDAIAAELNVYILPEMSIDITRVALLTAVPLLTSGTINEATRKILQILSEQLCDALSDTQIQQLSQNIVNNTNLCENGEDYAVFETIEMPEETITECATEANDSSNSLNAQEPDESQAYDELLKSDKTHKSHDVEVDIEVSKQAKSVKGRYASSQNRFKEFTQQLLKDTAVDNTTVACDTQSSDSDSSDSCSLDGV